MLYLCMYAPWIACFPAIWILSICLACCKPGVYTASFRCGRLKNAGIKTCITVEIRQLHEGRQNVSSKSADVSTLSAGDMTVCVFTSTTVCSGRNASVSEFPWPGSMLVCIIAYRYTRL